MLEWRVKSAKTGKSEFHSLSLHVSVDDHVDCMFRRKGKKKSHKTTLICLKVYVSLFNSCVKLCVCIYIYSSYCVRHDGDIEAFYCTIHVCVYNSDEDINWMAKC